MADYDSSLPVRTENDGDVVAKISDATTPSQQLAVNADGSINVTDNGGSLTVDGVDFDIRDLDFATDSVDVSGSTGVGVTATDLDIRDLDAGQDNIAISDGTDTLAVNADGSINSVVTATNLDIRDLVFATDKVDVSGSSNVAVTDGGGSLTVDGVDFDIRDLDFATDSVDVSGSTVVVTATDLDIRDLDHTQDSVAIGDGTDLLAINADGSINVNITDSTPGTPVNNYNTAAALASAASSNHDYTVTAATTLSFNQVWASASGKLKIQVQIETGVASGVFNTFFVGFNSTANPIIDLDIDNPPSVAAGVRVRVIRTNLDNQAQDVYSTICGFEV